MNRFIKSLAVLSALLIMTATASCGQVEDDIASTSENIGVSDEENSSEKNEAEESPDKEASESKKENSSNKKDKSSVKDDENSKDESSADDTTEESSAAPEKEDTTASQSGGNSQGNASQQKPDTPSGNTSGNTSQSGGTSSGGTQQTPSGGGNSSAGNSSAGNSSSSGGGSSSSGEPTTEAPVDETVYTAKITLGSSSSATGENVTASGQDVLISGGGEYYLSGTLTDGQVQVVTKEKVKLHLDGVDITCADGPAILIEDAKRATIRLIEGTVNTLSDGGNNKIYNGVISSNDTIEIRGKGTLNITAGNAHGIASDDDVVIENGNIYIKSVKSGIHVNDDITVNGGMLTVLGGTNGFKSKGTIHINGGTTLISGGTKEEKSSIYSAGIFTYTGGYLCAAGNLVTAPSEYATPYVVAGFTSQRPVGSNVVLYVNGAEAANFVPHNPFKCVIFMAPELTAGSSFSANINSSNYGNYTVSANSSENIFTLE